ncbi:hypothetical protein NC652_019079 [Populus alba x Populus x berolinensis]|uniref:Uncharacterized protein n=1 Tax=Populus alba x Populus x berolinensis TaxID=444605 RepID=A0AAD6QHJ6_9ROSI|nr:hypothetical protein NC652_019079 [Populus alba x Populus x berolinensis]KAJ6990505.1 hypothetical protein NC653_018920 [Populus alba x Populus x berolinensis]
MINLSSILFVQFLHFVSIPWIVGNLCFSPFLFFICMQILRGYSLVYLGVKGTMSTHL